MSAFSPAVVLLLALLGAVGVAAVALLVAAIARPAINRMAHQGRPEASSARRPEAGRATHQPEEGTR
jgi:hypothetical protein